MPTPPPSGPRSLLPCPSLAYVDSTPRRTVIMSAKPRHLIAPRFTSGLLLSWEKGARLRAVYCRQLLLDSLGLERASRTLLLSRLPTMHHMTSMLLETELTNLSRWLLPDGSIRSLEPDSTSP